MQRWQPVYYRNDIIRSTRSGLDVYQMLIRSRLEEDWKFKPAGYLFIYILNFVSFLFASTCRLNEFCFQWWGNITVLVLLLRTNFWIITLRLLKHTFTNSKPHCITPTRNWAVSVQEWNEINNSKQKKYPALLMSETLITHCQVGSCWMVSIVKVENLDKWLLHR